DSSVTGVQTCALPICLLVEATDVLRVGGHVGRQDLEGDAAVELRVAGADDGRHAANTDGFEQFVMGEVAAAEDAGEGLVGRYGRSEERRGGEGGRWVV